MPSGRVHPAILEQREADSHQDAAVDLAARRQRIDNPARVVHRDDVRHAHDSRLGVDLDFGKLASRLVGAKAVVVRHALALRGNRIAGNSLAHVVK